MGITHFCFGLSYLTALGMDLWQGWHPSRWPRLVSIVFTVAGLFAHTVFLALHQPSPASPYGSLLLLAWVFAVLYTYGNLHRKPTRRTPTSRCGSPANAFGGVSTAR
jgi:amino acid permease